jgi:dihydrofolate synthase/folylpolyglutamate synthase
VGSALSAALAQADPGDRILVFGSFHTAAAALQSLAPGGFMSAGAARV